MHPQPVVSLLKVLEINGQSFMSAVQEMRRVQAVINSNKEIDWNTTLTDDMRERLGRDVGGMIAACQELYARAALISAKRLQTELNDKDIKWTDIRDAMRDIESRLHDELGLVNLFVLDPAKAIYLMPAAHLLGQKIADRLPGVLFDMEEHAKCLAMGRSTASAFHAMRALEVAIRAIAKFLKIPDPTRPAERNWGTVLGAIKTKMDETYPAKARLPGSEGAEVEALYVSLDAIKNPWRNATMHAESIYQPHEAQHIGQCVNQLLMKLVELMDEDGNRIPDATGKLDFEAAEGLNTKKPAG